MSLTLGTAATTGTRVNRERVPHVTGRRGTRARTSIEPTDGDTRETSRPVRRVQSIVTSSRQSGQALLKKPFGIEELRDAVRAMRGWSETLSKVFVGVTFLIALLGSLALCRRFWPRSQDNDAPPKAA